MLSFNEFIEKMKKSNFKQKKSSGVRDIEDDLSKDYKGHIEKNGTVEPFELKKDVKKEEWNPNEILCFNYINPAIAKEGVEPQFKQFDRVRSKTDWRKTGEVSFSVPGDGTAGRYYNIIWDDGKEELVYSTDLEAE